MLYTALGVFVLMCGTGNLICFNFMKHLAFYSMTTQSLSIEADLSAIVGPLYERKEATNNNYMKYRKINLQANNSLYQCI